MKVIPATEGSSGIEISKLLTTLGVITLDPGFTNTGSTTSAITYIDGDVGILRYRGYPIEQLARALDLPGDQLPADQRRTAQRRPSSDAFTNRISRHTMLHEDLKRFFDGFPRDAHPMPVLSSAVSALSTFYQDALDPFNPEQVELSTIRLLAKLPTIAAYAYKKSVGQPLLYPDNSLGLVENFLRMSFGFPAEPYEVNPKLVKALDQLLILHADHEQNCSTSTVRLVGSSNANLFASVSAGINALFGPLHGGANQAVLEMLEKMRREGGGVDAFVKRVKNKEPGVKLMGFGHRVYKNYDPRAALVKATADEVLADLGANDELLDLAKQLEEVALSDDYFISRKLYPNVDFYTGLIYKAMGFPERMFTVLFAIGRLPGWIAQWREMINDPATKIGRPRQVYTGYTERDYLRSTSAESGQPGRPPARSFDAGFASRSAGMIGGMTSPTVLWFRRDLRLADHPALLAAAADNADVLGVFVSDDAAAAVRGAAPGISGRCAGRPVRDHGRPADGRPRPTGTGDPAGRRRCRRRRRACVGGLRPLRPQARRRRSRRHCRTRTSTWSTTGSPYAVAPRPGPQARRRRGTPSSRPTSAAGRSHGWRDRPAAEAPDVTWIDPADVDGPSIGTTLPNSAAKIPASMDLPEPGEAAALRTWQDFLDARGRPTTTTTGIGPITLAPAGCRPT